MFEKIVLNILWGLCLFISIFLHKDTVQAQAFVQKFEEAGCSLLVPDSLKYSQKTIGTDVGQIKYHTFYCEQALGKKEYSAVFQFSYCDYPRGMEMSPGLQDSLLIETIRSSVNKLDGVLIYRDPVRIGTSKGYFWRIHYNRGNAVMKSKAVFRGSRFYLIQVATLKKNATDEIVLHFLDSFRFL